MGNLLLLGMRLQQSLFFSPLFIRVPKSEAVFWPGCALMNLDGEILEKTMMVLRRVEPDIQLAAACCGQPSIYLAPDKAQERQEMLRQLLTRQGVRRIYTACPNCTLQMGELEGFEIIPVWSVLAEQIRKEDLVKTNEKFLWHDPCPTRNDRIQQESVRTLLVCSGCDWAEPEQSGERTMCCGNFRMLHITDPEKSALMRRKRIETFSEGCTIVSSCEGCLASFRGAGRKTMHLLELLFGVSRRRSYLNRIRTMLRMSEK